jgi:hypothetical protein
MVTVAQNGAAKSGDLPKRDQLIPHNAPQGPS